MNPNDNDGIRYWPTEKAYKALGKPLPERLRAPRSTRLILAILAWKMKRDNRKRIARTHGPTLIKQRKAS